MDSRAFDAVARTLASATSRRRALRLLAASALAALLPRPIRAAPARQVDGCAPGLTFCDEQPSWAAAGCYDLSTDYLHCGSCMHQCPSAGPVEIACIGGECLAIGCLEGEVDCTGNLDCADLNWDPNNCGSCGNVCASGTCEAGSCAQLACGDQTYCEVGESWYCADLSSDPYNCGECSVVCESGVCEGWTCAFAGCGEGLAFCPARSDGQLAGCYDLFSDYFHCGSCDYSCPTAGAPGVVCYAGECTLPPCDGGLIRCEGVGCVDLLFDPSNCGTCGVVCASGVCDGGTCAPEATGCAAGLTFCEEQPNWAPAGCYDLMSDYLHCGSCMHQCPSAGPSPFACIGGECVPAGCAEGWTECGGDVLCVDLASDPSNCGACGNVCASGTCELGTCVDACAPGLTSCPARSDGQPAGCFDLSADYWHCGTCGMSCPTAGFHGVCREGECVELACGEGLAYCTAGQNGLQPGCYDLSAHPSHCGQCHNACESGFCEAGACAQTATQAVSQRDTDTAEPEEESVQQAAAGSGGRVERTGRDRTRQRADSPPAATDQRAETSAPAPAPVLAWPFDPEAGHWAIVRDYGGPEEGEQTRATPAGDDRDFAHFAFEFAVCREENVDVDEGVCELGAIGAEPAWDREATRGSAVLSPVDGTVAWLEGESTCLGVAIDVKDRPGYRVALFNVDGRLQRGQTVKQGKRIGKVAADGESGCVEGDRLRMALYRAPAGSVDLVDEREGAPFAGEWAIAGCDYPDDGGVGDQYRGMLVPCILEDGASAGS